jgi:glycosyltransferase involved in cell wall biosynthesis
VTLPPRLRSFFDAHDPVLLTVGLLERHYDLPLQIDALGKVRARRARAGLVIVGSGSIEGELREYIARTPYADDVLLCGDVPHEVTLHAINACDLFLRTTLYDGDSISVREAQHLGVPVVATDNGMRPAGVRLVPLSNPSSLAETILLQLSPNGGAPRGARGDGTNGREDDRNVAAVFELYRELLGAGAS